MASSSRKISDFRTLKKAVKKVNEDKRKALLQQIVDPVIDQIINCPVFQDLKNGAKSGVKVLGSDIT